MNIGPIADNELPPKHMPDTVKFSLKNEATAWI